MSAPDAPWSPEQVTTAIKGVKRAERTLDLWILACPKTRNVRSFVFARPKKPENMGWVHVGEIDVDEIKADDLTNRISLACSYGSPAYRESPE